MKKKIALMLAMVMAVATMLTGCGGKDVSGNYTANVNLVEFMEAVNEPIEDAGVDLSNLSIDFVMSLNADKTFNFDFDTTAFNKSQENSKHITEHGNESVIFIRI